MDSYQEELRRNLMRQRLTKAEQDQVDYLYAKGRQVASSQGVTPQPAPLGPPTPSGPSFFGEASKAIVGGLRDAVQNTIGAAENVMDNLPENNPLRLLRLSQQVQAHSMGLPDAHVQLPEAAKNQTTGGNLARGLVQFAAPFAAYSKGLGVASLAGASRVAAGMGAGALTDFTVFDPHESRLSNLLTDWGKGNPVMDNAVTQYLKADPNDGAIEGRFKNVLEGMGLGAMAEGVLHGVKALKSGFSARGLDPAEAVKKAAEQEAARAAAEAGAAKEFGASASYPLRDQIDTLTGASLADRQRAAVWQKRLDVNAAVRDADGSAAPTAEAAQAAAPEAVSSPSRPLLDLVTDSPKATPPGDRRVFFDDHDGSILLTRDGIEGTPTAIPLEQKVAAAEAKAPHLRDANDLIAMRAFRQMQEATFPGLVHGDAEKALPGKLIIPEKVGSGPRVELEGAPAEAAPRAAEGAPAGFQVGDTISHSGGQWDPALKVLPNGKVMVEDAATGTKRVVTPDADPLHGASTNARGELGIATPQLMSHMAGSALGGFAGLNSAEDDATMADKLSLAGLGALAGLGVSVKLGSKLKGFEKVLSKSERDILGNPHPVAEDLARPSVRNIAPIGDALKSTPAIAKSKVEAFAQDYVQALKDGTTDTLRPDVSHFNFDRIDAPEDVKGLIDSVSQAFEKETAKATGGVQTLKETQQLAADLGLNAKSLTKLYGDTGNLASRVLAGRTLMNASAQKTMELARAAMDGNSFDLLAFRKQVASHAAIQAELKGVQTEVARALSQFRIQSQTVDLALSERNALIDALGGERANKRFAELLDGISDPARLHNVVRKGANARSGDALWFAWMQGLLSGPATHAANFIGNTVVATLDPLEHGLAEVISKIPVIGSGEMASGESVARMSGMVGGMMDALRITSRGFGALKDAGGSILKGDLEGASRAMSENSGEFGSAFQSFAQDRSILEGTMGGTVESTMRPISSEAFDLDPHSFFGKAADALGAAVGTPGRALQASDELFRTMHYRAELRTQAYREGTRQGLKGQELSAYVSDTLDNPSKTLHDQAMGAAKDGTFTAPLGEYGREIQTMLATVPGMRWVVPFVRTPVNILKYSGRRLPGLNLLSEQIRADMAAGGARRDLAIAKTVMGSIMLTTAGLLASSGVITGGGEKDQTSERLGGWQPYSIKMGDKYVSYSRLEPFSTLFGMAADAVNISGNVDHQTSQEVAGEVFSAISNDVLSKSFVKGLSGFVAGLGDAKKADNYLEQLVGSMVPSAVNTARRMDDPTIKEARTFIDSLKSRIPGLSKDVPARVDLFGRDVTYKNGWGSDLASPLSLSMVSDDPAAKELMRLNADLKQPGRSIPGPYGGKAIDLDPQQYRRLLQLAGNEAKIGDKGFHEALNELVQSDQYKAMPEQDDLYGYKQGKQRAVEFLHARYNHAASRQLLNEFPELDEARAQNRRNAIAALSGGQVAKPWWEQQ